MRLGLVINFASLGGGGLAWKRAFVPSCLFADGRKLMKREEKQMSKNQESNPVELNGMNHYMPGVLMCASPPPTPTFNSHTQ